MEELVKQVKVIAAGLNEASTFLLTMRTDAANPAQAGFNIPAEVLNFPDFKKAAAAYVSPDGHSVRYLVQTKLNPFSAEAMDQVNQIGDVARGAQPNTALSDATISMGGFPVALRDTRDYYQRDIRFIIAATLIVVLLTLMVLLRTVIAPLYLVGSVVVSYFAAIGIGVLTFKSCSVSSCIGASAFGVRGVGRGGRRLQHAVRVPVARRIPAQCAFRGHPHVEFDRRRDHRGGPDLRGLDGGSAVLQYRNRGPGRIRDRCGNSVGHLRRPHHHGARDRDAGRACELVAVAIRAAAAEVEGARRSERVAAGQRPPAMCVKLRNGAKW